MAIPPNLNNQADLMAFLQQSEARARESRQVLYTASHDPAPPPLIFEDAESRLNACPGTQIQLNWSAEETSLADAHHLSQAPGGWYCPYCAILVGEGRVKDHVDSRRHQTTKYLKIEQLNIRKLHTENKLPAYLVMKPVDGEEYLFCSLCGNFAVEGHMESDKHRHRVNQLESGSVQLWQPASEGMSPILPPEYGNPDWYEWKGADVGWWCKLCWKYANDGHISGRQHQTKVKYQSSEQASEGDPPPPPSASAVRACGATAFPPPPPLPRDGGLHPLANGDPPPPPMPPNAHPPEEAIRTRLAPPPSTSGIDPQRNLDPQPPPLPPNGHPQDIREKEVIGTRLAPPPSASGIYPQRSGDPPPPRLPPNACPQDFRENAATATRPAPPPATSGIYLQGNRDPPPCNASPHDSREGGARTGTRPAPPLPVGTAHGAHPPSAMHGAQQAATCQTRASDVERLYEVVDWTACSRQMPTPKWKYVPQHGYYLLDDPSRPPVPRHNWEQGIWKQEF